MSRMRPVAIARKLTVALVALAAPLGLRAEGRVECSSLQSRMLHRAVRYCILLPPSYYAVKTRRYPILYFLHGLGENEESLVNSGAWNIAEHLRETGAIGEMLIVTPDGDRSFYINSRDGSMRYEDFFMREFLPQIERQYRVTRAASGRGLGGVSMGGYGALRFAFKYPQEFSAVAVHMAAIYDRLPPALTAATTIGPRGGRLDAGSVFGSPPDEAFWERNSPLTLARHNARLKRLRIYFDCGDQDDYGFDQGARALDRLLSSEQVPHEFHLYPGRHDWAYVAAHFGEGLRFDWQALGKAAAAGHVPAARKPGTGAGTKRKNLLQPRGTTTPFAPG